MRVEHQRIRSLPVQLPESTPVVIEYPAIDEAVLEHMAVRDVETIGHRPVNQQVIV
ncbi:hypothetical protein D3C79_575370 [compost metagenome]